MFKVLCTGNPDHIGIAMEIKKLFPSSTFVSRTNGYDLSTAEGLAKLKSILKDSFHLDPAVRYQVVKNAFQRTLFDAIVSIYSISLYIFIYQILRYKFIFLKIFFDWMY